MEWLWLVLARPKHPCFPSNNLQPSHRNANVLQHYPSPWTSWACQKPKPTQTTQNPKPPLCLKNFALSRLVTRGGPRQAHLQDAEDSASFFDGSRRYGVQCRTSRSRPDPQVRFGDCEHDPPSLRCAAREFVLDSPPKRSRKTFAVSFLTRLHGHHANSAPPRQASSRSSPLGLSMQGDEGESSRFLTLHSHPPICRCNWHSRHTN